MFQSLRKRAAEHEEEFSSCIYWKKVLKTWFPILTWLPNYSLIDLKCDFVAGLTVGLTVVPQGLALAQLAGLPPQYGLYTAFMGSFMYAIFGTCKDLVIGPTSVMALMTAQHALNGGPTYTICLTFLCGCFQCLFGVLNIGFIMDFISGTVLSGFTSAAAIIIATTQLKGLLGLKFESRGFIGNIYNLCLNIQNTNLSDMGMGLFSVATLLILRHFRDLKCDYKCIKLPALQKNLRALWWTFVTARNAIVVIFCSIVASLFMSSNKVIFTLSEHVEAGLPPFRFPSFSVSEWDASNNVTMYKGPIDVLKDLGSGVIAIPLISLLEAVAIAKVFSKSKKLDSTREMIAVGMGNLMGSFVSSYPVTGSFSRTVINNSTGVRTPLGGIFSGSLVLLALGLIAPSFHYIPKASLCAILFTAVIFMIHLEDIPAMWRINKLELIPFSVTFLFSLTMGLEFGLLFGIICSLAMLLYKQNRPHIDVVVNKVSKRKMHVHVTPDICIHFPSIERLKGKITKALHNIKNDNECKVIIHGNSLTSIDYSTGMGLKNLVEKLKKDNIIVEFDVTDALALKVLGCLHDNIHLYKESDKTEDFEGGVCDEEMDENGDVRESDSVRPLLDSSESKSEDTAIDFSNNSNANVVEPIVHMSHKSIENKLECNR